LTTDKPLIIHSSPVPGPENGLANAEQDAQIGADFHEQSRVGLGMKCGVARCPIQTLEMVYQHCTLDFVHRDRQGKRIRLAATGERADHRESAGLVVGLIGDYQGGPSFRLLTPGLRIEIEPDQVSGARNVAGYHSTSSLPRAFPMWTSP